MTTRSLSNFSRHLTRTVTILTSLLSIPFLSFYWMTSAQLIADAVRASSNHIWLTPLSIALYLPFAAAATFVFGNLYAYILVSIAGIGMACVGLIWGRPNWLLRIWLLLVILGIVVFPFVLRYRPALTSAPGYEMQVVTDPGFFGGIVKASQNLVEHTPCDYQLIGWSSDNQLYYEAMCGTRAQVWRYSPTQPSRHTQISSRPKELGGYEMPKERLLEMVRADGVRPREYESVARPILLGSSGLVSPDGHWVALVTQHVYGTQDVIVLTDT
jgi:hypothetical protein